MLSRQSDFPKAQIKWGYSLILFPSMAFCSLSDLQDWHKGNLIIFLRLSLSSSLISHHCLCFIQYVVLTLDHLKYNIFHTIFPLSCALFFFFNDCLATLHCHPAYCASSLCLSLSVTMSSTSESQSFSSSVVYCSLCCLVTLYGSLP